MTSQYSVALSPPDDVIEQVRQLKQKLQSVIGKYGSANAMAHISFDGFDVNDDHLLSALERRIAGFAAAQAPQPLVFDHLETFPGNGTFFLAPDNTSELLLIRMKKIFSKRNDKSFKPHITIGRKLTSQQLSIAQTLIQEANIRFTCNEMVLRRLNLNGDRGQYDIYKRFRFGQ